MGTLHLNGAPLLIGGAALHFNTSATVGITVTRQAAASVAPHVVVMEVDLSALSGFTAAAPTGGAIYDARYHDIEYFWDFYHSGTDNSYTFTAPVNIYDGSDAWTGGYSNSRYAFGYQASHTFREPGTYTVRLTAHEPSTGTTAYATQEFTIADPAVYFSGNIISVSDGADLDATVSANLGNQESTPKRFELARGGTFSWSGYSFGNATDTPTVHIVAASGAGAKPIVNTTAQIGWDDDQTAGGVTKDMVWQNIVLNGTFDSTSDTDPTDDHYVLGVSNNPPVAILFDGCEIYDFQALCDSGGDKLLALNDTVIEGYSYGGAIFGHAEFAVTGCRVMSRTAAWVNATSSVHGWGLRIGNADTIIWASDFYNRQDSFGSLPRNGQPCIRFNADADQGTRINMHATSIEGWITPFSMTHSSSPDQGRAINAVLRNNYVIGSFQTASFTKINFGGTTLQNNIFVIPPMATEADRYRDIFAFIELDSRDNQTLNTGSRIAITHNTFVSRATSAGEYSAGSMEALTFTNTGNEFTAVTYDHNINHQPDLDTPINASAPLADDANTYFTPRCPGYQDSTIDDRTATAAVKTAGVTDLYTPETTSTAIGAASGSLSVTWRDFRGVVRSNVLAGLTRTAQSDGAMEPNLES